MTLQELKSYCFKKRWTIGNYKQYRFTPTKTIEDSYVELVGSDFEITVRDSTEKKALIRAIAAAKTLKGIV